MKGLFWKRKGKSKKNHLLALDIGTEFVKVLIFRIEKDLSEQGEEIEKGLVIGFGKEKQAPGHMLAGAVADIDGVTETCQRAIQEAVSLAKVKPEKAVIGIAGEFIKGATTSFIFQRENPEQKIDLAELKNIVQKTQWKAFNQVRSQLALETCRPEIEIRLVDALVTDIKIDGYQVTNPLGFQGGEIFLSIFNVYAPMVHLSALQNIASKLELELLSIAAEPYALTKSSGFNPKEGAIFIDIGGGTTDIALVCQNRVEGIKSFALAGRVFTKRLSKELGLGLNEAEEVKLRHSNCELSQGVQRKIRDILKQDIRIWLSGVELALEEFNQDTLPSAVLLCGGGSKLPGIKSILKNDRIRQEWTRKFSFNQLPQINFIKASHINNIVDQTGVLKGPEHITPMALASLSSQIAGAEKKVLPPILRRVVRIMR